MPVRLDSPEGGSVNRPYLFVQSIGSVEIV